MSVRTVQWWIASVFFVLGGWCLLAPGSVLELTITPAYRSDAPIVPILVGAFGAQALIAGLFAAFARFDRATFLADGLALLDRLPLVLRPHLPAGPPEQAIEVDDPDSGRVAQVLGEA